MQRQLNVSRQIRDVESLFPKGCVDKVKFSLLSSKEIEEQASVEIIKASLKGPGSLEDPKMGAIDDRTPCQTCFNSLSRCQGHFGFVKLAIPVINPIMKQVVLSLISCVCNYCSSVLLSKNYIKHNELISSAKGLSKLKAIKELSEKHGKCKNGCAPTPVYKTMENKDMHSIRYETSFSKDDASVVNIRTVPEIFTILDHITEDDLILMGFPPKSSHPRNYIIQNLVIIPHLFRPYIFQDGERKPDFVTSTYNHILNINNKLKSDSLLESERSEKEKSLASYIMALLSATSEVKGGTNRSLKNRLGGKTGIVRKFTYGKRTDYVFRSILGGGAELPYGYVGFPMDFKSGMTTKEVVTSYNIRKIHRMYGVGEIVSIIPADGPDAGISKMILSSNRDTLVPKCGDIVVRHIQNGDVITFNRQPTLFKAGMLGLRVLFHSGKTFRISSAMTKCTNADFDGDDANGYMHQTTASKVENLLISSIGANTENFNHGGVMTGFYYHAPLGAYKLSYERVLLDEEDFELGLSIMTRGLRGNDGKPSRWNTLPDRLNKYKIHPRSGKALISALFPEHLECKKGDVLIKEGVLIKGRLTSESLNGFGILHCIIQQYGDTIAYRFLSEAQWLFDWYLTIDPVSVGLHHIKPAADSERNVRDNLNRTQMVINKISADKSITSEIERESKILSALGVIEDKGKKDMSQTLSDANPIVQMYKSGAKGSINNLRCMMAMYGQELNFGSRPKLQYSNNTRFCVLTNFNSTDIIDRGFIVDSFVKGLSAVSFYQHMAAGRNGITTSIVSTPMSGQLSKQLNAMLASTLIGTSGEVVDTSEKIFMYSYSDNFDIAKMTINKSVKYGSEKYFINFQNTINNLIGRYPKKD